MSALTANELKALYHYEEETGLFKRAINQGVRFKKGSVAGYHHHTGYISIRIHGKAYQAHRLAWLYMFGEFPTCDIDHVNMVKVDNRICNLRLCSGTENNANTPAKRNGFKGVTKHSSGKYQAQIKASGVSKYLGLFSDELSAAKAYDKEAKNQFGKFAFLNFQEAA